jgi:hypothetical protein
MKTNVVLRNSDNNSFLKQYRLLLETFCSLVNKEGLKTIPYSEKSLNAFQNLPSNNQHQIVSDFKNYVDVCEHTLQANFTLKNSKQFLWKMLGRLQLRPTSDVFDEMSDQDIIEIYRTDHTQLFRNLKFLEVCTYPVADLYVRPWTDLYARPPHVMDDIVENIQACIAQKKTVRSTLPHYYLMELDSSLNQMFVVEQGIFSPLFDKDNSVVAFLCSIRAEIMAITNINTQVFNNNNFTNQFSSLGQFLKESRAEKGFGIMDIANSMKCNVQHLQLIEDNKLSPTGSTLIHLCKLYGVDVNDLLSKLTDESRVHHFAMT